ncbi:MAG: hypothetical protein GYA55_06410 [SAR324 cluster bacterium]|uniref:Uncharacterized protein n=1 Tax=SAR324 cluster bacterium TaxID=2024889 RepID=A0A7X9IJM2_9DELT|nr:hypothetical protein [SAR324 cluster bacterium]
MNETVMRDCCALVESLNKDLFDAIRISDLGALEWLLEKKWQIKLHISCETGSNNIGSIKSLCDHVKKKRKEFPERVLLSLELPEIKICEYAQALPSPCEYLGAGGIEIFYSARRLLSSSYTLREGDNYIEAIVSSPEASDRPLRCIETIHGTLLYLDKDQFVLDRTHNLETARLHSLRIDMRDHPWEPSIDFYIDGIFHGFEDRIPWPRGYCAPFFESNETTKEFNKLKASRIYLSKGEVVAEVIASEKEKFVAYVTKEKINLNGVFSLMNSTGKEIYRGPLRFRNSDGAFIENAPKGALIISSWLPGTQAGAVLGRS